MRRAESKPNATRQAARTDLAATAATFAAVLTAILFANAIAPEPTRALVDWLFSFVP